MLCLCCSIVRHEEVEELPRGPRIVALERMAELVELLDYDTARKLSGEYILLTQQPLHWQILTHPLFNKVSRQVV